MSTPLNHVTINHQQRLHRGNRQVHPSVAKTQTKAVPVFNVKADALVAGADIENQLDRIEIDSKVSSEFAHRLRDLDDPELIAAHQAAQKQEKKHLANLADLQEEIKRSLWIFGRKQIKAEIKETEERIQEARLLKTVYTAELQKRDRAFDIENKV